MTHCQKKHRQLFVQHPVRNVCAKFKVDHLRRFYTGAHQVFTIQKTSLAKFHENCNTKFLLNTFFEQITICLICFDISTSNYSRCFPKILPNFLEDRCSFREVFHKSSCSVKWCDETQLLCTSGEKKESVTGKFTKNCTTPQILKKLDKSSEQQY